MASQLPPNRHEWDAGAVPITAGQLAGIVAQTVVLCGSNTRLVLRETVAVLADAFPQWRVVGIPGAGHMGPLTHSASVNECIKAFLMDKKSV